VILLLGPECPRIEAWFRQRGHALKRAEEKLRVESLAGMPIELAVSFRYRHIIPPDVVRMLPGRLINLHVSFLPWNRGADPNLWSFIENTPKGVTVHFIDEGLDTGDIVAQRELELDIASETLATSYAKLNDAIIDLFLEVVPALLTKQATGVPQTPGAGSYHSLADRRKVEPLLVNGWDTPVSMLCGGKHVHES
jgi:methionyl-tRNA formyltransferase